jgi:hypothetical protein
MVERPLLVYEVGAGDRAKIEVGGCFFPSPGARFYSAARGMCIGFGSNRPA